jgi:hypothetical protein
VHVHVTDLIAIGRGLVGEQVKKQFGVVWFSGTVTSFKGGVDLWKIIYEDHDQEQVDTRHSELAADPSNSNFYFIKLQS